MRLSAGGYYQIAGAGVKRVTSDRAGPVGLAIWRARYADLWAESSTIVHEERSLTAEECGLCNAMWREMDVIRAAILSLERAPAVP
jgi:hypothetical protein